MKSIGSKISTPEYNSAVRMLWRDALVHWKEHLPTHENRILWPMQYPEMKKAQIVVIGFNPSFSPGNFGPLKDAESRAPRQFYVSSGEDLNSEAPDAIQFEHDARGRGNCSAHRHYKNIHDAVGEGWESIDLIPARKTAQREISRLFTQTGRERMKIGGEAGLEFARTVRELTYRLLHWLEPRGIWIADAGAARLILDDLGLHNRIGKVVDGAGYKMKITLSDRDIPTIITGAFKCHYTSGGLDRMKNNAREFFQI